MKKFLGIVALCGALPLFFAACEQSVQDAQEDVSQTQQDAAENVAEEKQDVDEAKQEGAEAVAEEKQELEETKRDAATDGDADTSPTPVEPAPATP